MNSKNALNVLKHRDRVIWLHWIFENIKDWTQNVKCWKKHCVDCMKNHQKFFVNLMKLKRNNKKWWTMKYKILKTFNWTLLFQSFLIFLLISHLNKSCWMIWLLMKSISIRFLLSKILAKFLLIIFKMFFWFSCIFWWWIVFSMYKIFQFIFFIWVSLMI